LVEPFRSVISSSAVFFFFAIVQFATLGDVWCSFTLLTSFEASMCFLLPPVNCDSGQASGLGCPLAGPADCDGCSLRLALFSGKSGEIFISNDTVYDGLSRIPPPPQIGVLY